MANLLNVPKDGITAYPNEVFIRYLDALLRTGLYGNNRGQALEGLATERLRELVRAGHLNPEAGDLQHEKPKG